MFSVISVAGLFSPAIVESRRPHRKNEQWARSRAAVSCNSDRSDTRRLLNLQLGPVRFRPVQMEELAAGLVHALVSMRTEIVALALQ